MEEIVQKFKGYVSRIYDDSMVLRLWDDSDPNAITEIKREFEKEMLHDLGIKNLGQPVEFIVLSIDGKPKVRLSPIGAPGGPISIRDVDPESIKEFND
jgi:hypothetical protein